MNIDRDLGEIHGLLFGFGRHVHGELTPWTTIDIVIAGRGQIIDADSHTLTMRLPRGREVELLMTLRDQVQAALSTTHRDITDEIDKRLAAEMEIHHINGNRLDNRRANIEVIAPRDHRRKHTAHLHKANAKRAIYPRERDCAMCGTRFAPHPDHRGRDRCCSRACSRKMAGRTRRRNNEEAKCET